MELISEDEVTGMMLLESYRYWSKRRLLFNIIVGIAGLFSVFSFLDAIAPFDVFGMLIWGVVANALYSTGYVLESYIIATSKGQKSIRGIRNLLFWGGTVAYVVVSIVFVMMYALPFPF